ncbi:MAG TPA: hypothetical protein VNZ54_09390 [bacterium]|jgi:hypothetical protein|nr:hypothetical protein [bacterium]
MAELSVEEAQRLARNFLTGLAGDADVSRLESALADDQTLALELLAQMQTALEDVAPEGLTQDQVKSVDARVEALVGPRIRRRGLFGIFKRLFKRRRKPVPARVAKRPEAPEPEAAPAPAPAPVLESPALPDGEGMEEMAPIAPSAPLPSEALAHLDGVEAAPAEAPPAAASGPGFPWLALLGGALVLGLIALAGSWAWARHRARPKPAPVLAAAPPPSHPAAPAAPAPAPQGPAFAQRGLVMATKDGIDTLPAAIPPTTPQAAGQLP